MMMPGRKFSLGDYRYGFNGKENDNEIKGEGNQQDYGMRIYDPRISKFLSVDPITRNYPELTPYQFASNRPIDGIDLDGLEFMPYHTSMYRLVYITERHDVRSLSGAKLTLNSSREVVQSVYQNIPNSLRNPNTGDFLMVNGLPVGTNGEDYKGMSIHPVGRYNNLGNKFNGLGSEGNDFSSNNTTGLYHFDMGYDAQEMNEIKSARIASKADGLKHLIELGQNLFNSFTWDDLNKEFDARKSFYSATKFVDFNIEQGGFPKMSRLDRVHLINFIADGTLFTDYINPSSLTKEGIYNSLQTANLGVDALNQIGKLRDKTRTKVSGLLNKYIQSGGDRTKFKTLSNNLKSKD